MRYKQFKGVIEREYGKSLRKVMYELCVIEGLNAVEGAKRLGVAKEVFVFWRHHYRFEKRQLSFDETVKDLKNLPNLYVDEVKEIDLKRPFLHEQEESLRGLEELVNRMIEYYKCRHVESEGLAVETAKLSLYEFTRDVLESYREGKLLCEVKKHCGS